MVDRRTKAFKAKQIAPVRRRAVSEAAPAPMAAGEPAAPAAEPVSALADASDATPPKFRRKRASTGGIKLKLHAPQRPGFVRRFVKNNASRILEINELGYDFATADTKTDGMGSHIERHAGKGEFGEPEHLVLMETPESEYAVGVAEKEEQRKPFEQALRAGRATDGELTDQYQPGSARTSFDS